MIYSAISAIVALAASGVSAVPNVLYSRQAPGVLYPTPDAPWVVGWRHNITWDTSSVTSSSPHCSAFLANDGYEDTGSPLASDIDLTPGRIEITVPDVPNGGNYQIFLTCGDQTTASAQFVIADSKDDAAGISGGSTPNYPETIVFPDTTIVATSPGTTMSALSSAVSASVSASSAVSSINSSASSALSSISASAASAESSILSHASSALSSATAPAHSATGSKSAGSPSAGVPFDAKTGIILATVIVAFTTLGGALVL